jgi:GT2 family glycosyltransferase
MKQFDNKAVGRHSLPLVSAVIVTHNNKEWLARSIPSLLEQSMTSLEIIVVDNASLDHAHEYVHSKFPDVKVVRLKTNKGFGAGVNAGMRAAKGEYILVANEDMIFAGDYLKSLVEVMERDLTVAVCQGTTYFYKRKKEVQSRGLFFNLSGVLVGDKNQASVSGKKPVEIFSATAPFLTRKEFVEAVGGFDEDFFLYFEEVDVCWRIWLNGRRVVFVPGAKAYHVGGGSTSKLPQEFILKESIKNRIQSYLKNLGFERLIIALIIQVIIYSAGWMVLFLRGNFAQSWAILRAWGWNIRHLSSTYAKRLRIQRSRVADDKQIFKRVGGPLPINKLLFISGIKRRS